MHLTRCDLLSFFFFCFFFNFLFWSCNLYEQTSTHTHTHTHTHIRLTGPLFGTIRVSQYQKGKTDLDFTEARDSGISWAICKSASRSRQITMPTTHHSVFLQAGCPSSRPTNSIKALKANKHKVHKTCRQSSSLPTQCHTPSQCAVSNNTGGNNTHKPV